MKINIFNSKALSFFVLLFSVGLSMAKQTGGLPESAMRQTAKSSGVVNPTVQNTITAIQTQAINFGTYCVTGKNGGTISIGWDGIRSSTGNIVLMNMLPNAQPAIFEIKASNGQYVTISYPATSTVTRSNGGSLRFDIGPTEKGINGSGFSINNDSNFSCSLHVGGTLYIPPTAIPGIYSGLFEIHFTL